MKEQQPSSSRRDAGRYSVDRIVRIIWLAFFYAVWTPIFFIIWTPLFLIVMGAALLATVIYPGKWENGTWTRIYPNVRDHRYLPDGAAGAQEEVSK